MQEKNYIDWRGVPSEFEREWQRTFQATTELLDLAAPCPVCGSASLHRWYDLHRIHEQFFEGKRYIGKGSLWEWCSACRCYEHYLAAVPEWWWCNLHVDLFRVTAEPGVIEEARLERERQKTAGEP